MAKPIKRNWRDCRPSVGHDNAIVWHLLNSAAKAEAAADDAERQAACLQRLSGFARHMLQSGMSSNYHSHPHAEQMYYILRGRGTLVVDGERYPVREGDVVYLPAGAMHQAVNDSDDWMEHLILTAQLG